MSADDGKHAGRPSAQVEDARTGPVRWPLFVAEGCDGMCRGAVFYFHAVHSYAILRHNGVPLGKTDYIGHLSLH